MDAEELIRQTSASVRSALDAAQRRADEIVSQAEQEAQRIRDKAEAEARERLDQVREALEKLEEGLGAKLAPQASNRDSHAPEPEPTTPEPELEPKASEAQPAPAEPAVHASNEVPGDDAGAARLVAMKLALDGTSRDQAREQLAADYEVADLDSLLEEVYSKAGK